MHNMIGIRTNIRPCCIVGRNYHGQKYMPTTKGKYHNILSCKKSRHHNILTTKTLRTKTPHLKCSRTQKIPPQTCILTDKYLTLPPIKGKELQVLPPTRGTLASKALKVLKQRTLWKLYSESTTACWRSPQRRSPASGCTPSTGKPA